MKWKRNLMIAVILFIGIALNAQSIDISDSTGTEGSGSYEIFDAVNFPIKIPFRMHKGKPLFDLEINDKKATLMIDNGVLWDQVWLFGSQLVDELQMKSIEEGKIGGAGQGDSTIAYISNNLTLKFNNIIFYEQPVLVSPPAAGFFRMFPGADGQLCNTFFRHFIVEFDFINNEVLLHHPNQYKYIGNGSILEMNLNESGTYSVPFTFTMLDGKIYNDKIDIDLGGIYELKVALNNKHEIQLPTETKRRSSFGAQGEMPEFSGIIESMIFGKYIFEKPSVIFGDEKTSRIHPGNLGVIGLPLFMKFNIVFDYFNNKIYIDPNSNFDGSFED